MNKNYTKILHVNIGTIKNWNCEKYRKEIEDILGPEYYLTFTGSNIKVGGGSTPAEVISLSIAADDDTSMRELVSKITKLKESNQL